MYKRLASIILVLLAAISMAVPAFAAKDLDIRNDTTSFFYVSGTSGNVGVGTTESGALLHVGGGAGAAPDAMSITGADAYIKGNLEVDGKIYGDGSQLTGISGAVSGLTTYAVPRASSDMTIVDSGIYLDVNGNVGIGTTSTPSALTFPRLSSGIALYNTADQTTNYEVGTLRWNASTLTLNAGNGGTGNARNLSIGTKSRAYLIDETAASGAFYNFINTTASTAAILGLTTIRTSAAGSNIEFKINPVLNLSGTAGYTALLINPTENTLGSGSATLQDWQVGGVSKMIVLSSGNVGIGTSVPRAKLEVVGSGSTTGTAFQIDDNLYNPKVTVLDNGNVGIGTTAPVANLHVGAGSPSPSLAADLSSNSALIKGNLEVDGKIYGDGSQLTNIAGAVSGLTNYSVPRSQADGKTLIDSGIYTDANGNVGIGTTVPGDKLVVNGGALKIVSANGSMQSVKFSNAGTPTWQIGNRPGANNNLYFSIGVNTEDGPTLAAAAKATIMQSGNVGIATTTPGEKLQVRGAIRWSGALESWFPNSGSLSQETSGTWLESAGP
ncbi:MAG: hypothetical protein V2A70_08270, partial [Candidatus Omnitrophota bacterium]